MKRIFLLMAVIALTGLPASAQKDENNRIENAGQVMTEILNIPDDIPADLLDKAECVIVLPSVMRSGLGDPNQCRVPLPRWTTPAFQKTAGHPLAQRQP